MLFEVPWQRLAVIVPLVFLSGLMDAIAGGGGLISLPAYLLAGVPPHQAVATNKLSSSIGTTISTARYIKNGCVDWPLAVPSAVLAILGAAAGARLILFVPESVMRYFLIAVLPLVALLVLKKRDFSALECEPLPRGRQFAIVSAASLTIGMYDGFYGPGTGTFMLLVLTQMAHLSVRTASGNVKIMNLSSNLGSLAVFLLKGQAILPLGLIAGAAALAGQYIGAGLVLTNGAKVVRPIVLVVLALLFLRVILELAGVA